MAGALAAALLAHQPVDRVVPQAGTTQGINGTVELVTLSTREAGVGPHRHLVLAVSIAGDVVGAILTRNGTAVCYLEGVFDFDSGCLTLAGCGSPAQTVCR